MRQRTPEATIDVLVIARLIQYGTLRGLQRDQLLRAAEVTSADLDEPSGHSRVTAEQADQLMGHMVRALDDSSVPLQLAQLMRIEDYQVLGFAVMTSADGSEALHRMVRYWDLITDIRQWSITQDNATTTLETARRGSPSLGYYVSNEYVLAALIQQFRRLSGRHVKPTRVTFVHGGPADTGAHEHFFDCPVQFGASVDACVFRTDWLSFSLPSANPSLHEFFVRHAEELLAVAPEPSIGERVSEEVQRQLASGPPSMRVVAERMKMSERTLRRYLADETTSFTSLVEGVRRRRAESLLRDRCASLAEVSFLCGFSDESTFSRAFRRWHSMTPAAFRSKHS